MRGNNLIDIRAQELAEARDIEAAVAGPKDRQVGFRQLEGRFEIFP